ncbi:unnamed protein product [Diatraea saccharalis]|uniref:Brf1 TBP-binding domain-containing protein n=1 Tax=Diatraea saccharalis TaxID=40085 RepID=A0A9N9R457_9NEOP|nr:unnamed protein product [Diatraea saccharalis]
MSTVKEELRAKERLEGKKKKVRGAYKKKVALSAATAGEAIGKMLQEKKISSKINYDILRSLDAHTQDGDTKQPDTQAQSTLPSPARETVSESPTPRKRKRKEPVLRTLPPPPPTNTTTTPIAPATPRPATPQPVTPQPATPSIADASEDYEDELEPQVPERETLSLAAMLQNGQDDDYYDYDEY